MSISASHLRGRGVAGQINDTRVEMQQLVESERLEQLHVARADIDDLDTVLVSVLLEAQADAYLARDGKQQSSLQVMRYIGSRTFYQAGTEWQDSIYDPAKHKQVQDVEVGSDEYFKLLKEDARLAKYLALGDVVVPVKGQWYRFVQKQQKKS